MQENERVGGFSGPELNSTTGMKRIVDYSLLSEIWVRGYPGTMIIVSFLLCKSDEVVLTRLKFVINQQTLAGRGNTFKPERNL